MIEPLQAARTAALNTIAHLRTALDQAQAAPLAHHVLVGLLDQQQALSRQLAAVAEAIKAEAQRPQPLMTRQVRDLLRDACDYAESATLEHDAPPSFIAEAEAIIATCDAEALPDRQHPAKVKVEVTGGVADVTAVPPGVEVIIFDHDNESNQVITAADLLPESKG